MTERFLICVLVFVWVSCTQQQQEGKESEVVASKKDSILVGMTYEEVEKLLGRPLSIERGVQELEEGAVTRQPATVLDSLKENLGDSRLWVVEMTTKTVGTLLYVCWVNEGSRLDSHYTFVSTEGPKKRTKYFVDGKEVTKRVYDLCSDGNMYLDPDGYAIDAGMFQAYEKSYKSTHRRGQSVPVKRSTRVVEVMTATGGAMRQYYTVLNLYSVVFDASSGRVVTKGYYPVSIGRVQ